jgi:hypothetical protein
LVLIRPQDRTPRTFPVRGVLPFCPFCPRVSVRPRRYGEVMKYVVMIYRSVGSTWTDEDQRALGRLMKLEGDLAASGELLSSEGLLPPEEGRIVQIRDGVQVVTDGPFGEAKEQLAGFFMVDVPDDDQAKAIAARVSAAAGDRVELRGTVI